MQIKKILSINEQKSDYESIVSELIDQSQIVVVYHLKIIPRVSSVGKFRTGRIVYHLPQIPIMKNVFHFFTQWRLLVRTKIVNYLELV